MDKFAFVYPIIIIDDENGSASMENMDETLHWFIRKMINSVLYSFFLGGGNINTVVIMIF